MKKFLQIEDVRQSVHGAMSLTAQAQEQEKQYKLAGFSDRVKRLDEVWEELNSIFNEIDEEKVRHPSLKAADKIFGKAAK